MKVIILSGIPGAGKSTLARKFDFVVSADDYFIGKPFDPSKLSEAHALCFKNFLSALSGLLPVIVVDNTNLNVWEISPYMLAAAAYGVEAKVVRISCGFEEAFKRQIHDVPRVTLARMHVQFLKRDVLPWWKVSDYLGGDL